MIVLSTLLIIYCCKNIFDLSQRKETFFKEFALFVNIIVVFHMLALQILEGK